jgi:hypothetical protein
MVEDILTKYGERFISELSDAIRNKPLPRKNGKAFTANASGDLIKSLDFKVDATGLRVYGNRYIGALMYGRKPTSGGGSGELKKAIRKWIDEKGITPRDGVTKEGKTYKVSKEGLAFIIARKIHEEGTLLFPNGSDLVSAIVTEEFINSLINELFISFMDSELKSYSFLKRAA